MSGRELGRVREQEIASMRVIMKGGLGASSVNSLHFWAVFSQFPTQRKGLIFYNLIGPEGSFTACI